jgi:protoporphyrinogen/coproporphyrinogen III oxidase
MSETIYDAIIVGGGPAGLAAAWMLRDRKILLLEERDRLGGRLKSEPRGDYWLNFGGHLFPGADSNMQRMTRALGLEVIEIPGSKTGLVFDGAVHVSERIEAYPLVLPMTWPERIALARVGLRLLAVVRKWRRVARPRPGEPDNVRRARIASYACDKSFRDILGVLPPRVDEIFQAAGRRAGCELEEQSAGVGAALFGAVWSGKKDNTALNLRGGSGQFGAAMARELGTGALLGARGAQVVQADGVVQVDYTDAAGEHRVEARHVIVAVPAPIARAMVRDIPADLDRALALVRYGPWVAMSMLTTESGPMPWDDVYALTVAGLSFDMFFNHANPLRGVGPRSPGGSLMCYAGGASAHRMLSMSDAEIEKIYKQDLYKIYPQLRGIIGDAVIQRWPLGGQYRAPGDASFDALLRYSAQEGNVVHYAGDYFAPLGQMEVAATAGMAAAEAVRRQLPPSRVA